jgi:hypothetical protein
MRTFDKDQYVSAAIAHAEASQRGDYRTANRQFTILKRAYRLLEKDVEAAANHLRDLMRCDDRRVRLAAAVHAFSMGVELKEARDTLEELSVRTDIGLVSLSAERALGKWDRGRT